MMRSVPSLHYGYPIFQALRSSRSKVVIKSQDQKPQRERFIEAARELGADDDEATFNAKLAVIGKQKPRPPEPEPSKGEL